MRQRIIRGGFAASRVARRQARLRKKPKALQPWAESTNEGGGGDNWLEATENRNRRARLPRFETSVGAFLLHCNIEGDAWTVRSTGWPRTAWHSALKPAAVIC